MNMVAKTRIAVNPMILDALKTRQLTLVEDLGSGVTKDLLQEITQGIIAGESVEELKDRIKNTSGFVEKYKNQAETIARTESMLAANTGLMESLRSAGIEQVQFLAAIDDRTCDDCAALDMHIYAIDEAPLLPIHPNCRCTYLSVPPEGSDLVPFTDEEIEAYREGNMTPDFRPEKGSQPVEKIEEPPAVKEESVASVKETYQELKEVSGTIDTEALAKYWKEKDEILEKVQNLEKSLPSEVYKYTRELENPESIKFYQGLGFNPLNGYLRYGTKSEYVKPDLIDDIQNHLATITEQIEKAPPIPKGIELWRGLGSNSGRDLYKKGVGDIISDKGFQSFSMNPLTGKDFAYSYWVNSELKYRTIIRAVTTGKERGVYLPRLGSIKEYEFMMKPGSEWKIISKDDIDTGKEIIHLVTVIPK